MSVAPKTPSVGHSLQTEVDKLNRDVVVLRDKIDRRDARLSEIYKRPIRFALRRIFHVYIKKDQYKG